jgi:hypothetical protein
MDTRQKSRQYVLWKQSLLFVKNGEVDFLTYFHFGEFEASEKRIFRIALL